MHLSEKQPWQLAHYYIPTYLVPDVTSQQGPVGLHLAAVVSCLQLQTSSCCCCAPSLHNSLPGSYPPHPELQLQHNVVVVRQVSHNSLQGYEWPIVKPDHNGRGPVGDSSSITVTQ